MFSKHCTTYQIQFHGQLLCCPWPPESIQKRKGEPTDLPSAAPSLHPLPFSMLLFHRYYYVTKLRSKDSLPNSSTMREEESRSPQGWQDCKECDTSIRREADSSGKVFPVSFSTRRCRMRFKGAVFIFLGGKTSNLRIFVFTVLTMESQFFFLP